jgi:hypothetical protein
MIQTVMTFVTKVEPQKADALKKLLAQINDDPETNSVIPFRSLKMLHFASLVVFESEEYGRYLVFENNFDGHLEAYLTVLGEQAEGGLHQIYSCCKGYAVQPGDRNGLLAYLKHHVVHPNAYHIGNTGRSVKRILDERALRDFLEDQADDLAKSGQGKSAKQLEASLRQFVSSNPDFRWVADAEPRRTFSEKLMAYVNFGLAVIVLLIFSPVEIILLLVLRYKESRDEVPSGAADIENLRTLVQREDRTRSVQNHMASITIVKPGWLRRSALRLVLWAINKLARAFATKGNLSGIPSIHFAHWSLLDEGRRLLFLSNFDGSWENYLDDFIDKASRGLTAVWSNTVRFPRTTFLIYGGANDGPRFKAVARNSQTFTNAWYSAYLDLTVKGIDSNSSIREEILNPPDPAAWLQRL